MMGGGLQRHGLYCVDVHSEQLTNALVLRCLRAFGYFFSANAEMSRSGRFIRYSFAKYWP
jgi:uncharacterized protein YqjF (DUF2071 family)